MKNNDHARGFTLLEVLIAIIIFAIGLLGIAGLQVAGLRFTKGSQMRASATLHTENMVDRMRANMIAVGDGSYDIQGAMPTASVDCDAGPCTSAQLATFDLVQWENGLAGALEPSASGVVCLDATPNDGNSAAWACDGAGNVFAVKIDWLERQVERSGVEDTYATGGASGVAGYSRNRFVMRVIP
jgi:type IV pilus assembly protein PilV